MEKIEAIKLSNGELIEVSGLEKIEAYKVSTGTIFEDKDTAFKRQREIDFFNWYEDNGLYADDWTRTDSDTVLEWLLTHKDVIIAMYERSK